MTHCSGDDGKIKKSDVKGDNDDEKKGEISEFDGQSSKDVSLNVCEIFCVYSQL